MKTPIIKVMMVKDGSATIKETRGNKIKGSADAAALFASRMDGAATEQFWVAGLDAKNRVIGVSLISTGTLTQSLVHPREVFKPLVLMNAVSFMVGHNHPSGDTAASQEDRQVTKRLREVGDLMAIPMLDHLIVYAPGAQYYSFADRDWK